MQRFSRQSGTKVAGKSGKRSGGRLQRFSWAVFLDERGVDYRPTGSGWLEIHCPLCGESDRGRHMGVNSDVDSPGWNCWRDADHRGRNPARLVAALVGCSERMAQEIIALQVPPEENQLAEQAPEEADRTLEMPSEFKPISRIGYGRQFVEYLIRKRGFGWHYLEWQGAVEKYDLRYCLVGEFAWRLIVPIYHEGRLVSWTGRAIRPDTEPRYKTLSDKPGKSPRALVSVKRLLYRQDELKAGGHILAICEGPFDAIKAGFYGAELGVQATCLFGKDPVPEQLTALASVIDGFDTVVVLLDADAMATSWKLVETLRELRPRASIHVWDLPVGVKDPGELTKKQVQELFSSDQAAERV